MITQGTKWIKTKGAVSNVWAWELVIENNGKHIKICEILQQRKGEYIMPEIGFPLKANGEPQKSRVIHKAKYDCEKWFADFLKVLV